MITHSEHQGSKEWLQLRSNYFTASEASAALDESKYLSRNELLKQKKTGVTKEIDSFTQNLFNKGHEAEKSARVIIEKIIQDELFNVTGSTTVDNLKLLASFDGLTFENIVFEHKLWNTELAKSVKNKELPPHYYWQLEHQLLVADSDKAIFCCSDGTEDNFVYMEYYSIPERREKLIDGWKQFKKDLENFEVTPEQIQEPVKTIEQFPGLNIQIKGEVTSSNLELYKNTALDFINSINTDLQSDQDFATAENVVKFCKKAETELETAKNMALSQTSDIDTLIKTVDHLKEEMRSKRLYLDKLVKTKKQEVKSKIVQDATSKIYEYIQEKNKEITPVTFNLATFNFQEAIKGKKTLKSIQNAIDSEIASTKIYIDGCIKEIKINLGYIAGPLKEYGFLFNDLQNIANKEFNDFTAIVDSRIAKYQQDEKDRLEAERKRIEAQEKAKLEAEKLRLEQENQRKLETEKEKIRQEEQQKIRQEEQQNKSELSGDTGQLKERPGYNPPPEEKRPEPPPKPPEIIKSNTVFLIEQLSLTNKEKEKLNQNKWAEPLLEKAFQLGLTIGSKQ